MIATNAPPDMYRLGQPVRPSVYKASQGKIDQAVRKNLINWSRIVMLEK
jgi:hypothetical protein